MLEFGRGFGYKEHLAIGMQNVGGAILKQIVRHFCFSYTLQCVCNAFIIDYRFTRLHFVSYIFHAFESRLGLHQLLFFTTYCICIWLAPEMPHLCLFSYCLMLVHWILWNTHYLDSHNVKCNYCSITSPRGARFVCNFKVRLPIQPFADFLWTHKMLLYCNMSRLATSFWIKQITVQTIPNII